MDKANIRTSWPRCALPRKQVVQISTTVIELGALLKWAGLVETGGQAKQLIMTGKVFVNGRIEKRRGRIVKPGDVVMVQNGPTLIIAQADRGASPPSVAS